MLDECNVPLLSIHIESRFLLSLRRAPGHKQIINTSLDQISPTIFSKVFHNGTSITDQMYLATELCLNRKVKSHSKGTVR